MQISARLSSAGASALSWWTDLANHYSRYGDQDGQPLLLHHRSMTGWVEKAACRQFDPELFFPLGSGPATAHQAAQAKAVCACCQVSAQCLTWALRHREVDGIWGGLDAEERRALNTQREVSNIARLVSGTGSGEPVSFPGSHRSRLRSDGREHPYRTG